MSAITYLLQVSGCMAIFYLFYYLLLNRLTFFTINRYYLVVTLVLSFIIPALTIPVHDYTPVVQHAVQVNNFKNLSAAVYIPKAAAAATPEINWLLLLKTAYLLVAAGLFVRLIIMLAGFFARLKNKQVKRIGNINIVHGNKQLTNGSFLNYIFLDDAELNPAEIQQIIAHEMLHVKLMHSADRIVVKIIQIILWFNPFAYLYARSIEENHEFEVDREIALSTDKTEYADLLLHLSVAGQGMIYNNFSTVPLKKRIIMLFNQPSAKAKRMVYILVVPVLILSCMAFATFKKIKADDKTTHKEVKLLKNINVIGTPFHKATTYQTVAAPVQDAQALDKESAATEEKFDSSGISVIDGVEKTGPNFLVLIDKKEYPKNILYKIGAACISGYGIFRPDYGLQKYGTKASDGYIEIRTKKGEITYMTPIEKENLIKEHPIQALKFYTRLQLKKPDGSLYNRITMNVMPGGEISGDLQDDAKAGFYIDKTFYDENSIQKVSPATIASLTGEYGVRANDPKVKQEKDYAIIFEFNTKKTSSVPTPYNDTVKRYSIFNLEGFGPNPLVLINGKEYTKDILYKISGSSILGGHTYPPAAAVKKFGDKAKDGCVEIKTQNGEIVYMQPGGQENLAKLDLVPKTQFFARVELKDDKGGTYDKIIMHSPAGGGATTEVSHNGKVAYFINKVYYTEDQIKKITPEQHALMIGMYGVKDLDPKKYPKVNLHGFEAIFFFEKNGSLPRNVKDLYPYEQHLPANE